MTRYSLFTYFCFASMVVALLVYFQLKNYRPTNEGFQFKNEVKVLERKIGEIEFSSHAESKNAIPAASNEKVQAYPTRNVDRVSVTVLRKETISELDSIRLSFIQCYNEDFSLESYINGYTQMYLIFLRLGTVFNIMTSDMKKKVDILNTFRSTDNPHRDSYEKVEGMMMYEIQVNNETGAQMFGSRTLLRLHRAMKFIMLFLEGLNDIKEIDSVSTIASKAYKDSLANHHSWLLRKAADIAMLALPVKSDFMKRIYPGNIDRNTLREKLRFTIEAIKNVYFSVQDLYNKYDLVNLP